MDDCQLDSRCRRKKGGTHCPNVLTVCYFKTSSGGIPAPRASLAALRILGCGGWCWHGVGACPMIEVATLQTLGGPDMSNATFSAPDMTIYCGLEELGLVAVGMCCGVRLVLLTLR